MIHGYARVSTGGQSLDAQVKQLKATGCAKVWQETASGASVTFCMTDDHMILLHSFIKKTQKTPQADIDLALKRKREVT